MLEASTCPVSALPVFTLDLREGDVWDCASPEMRNALLAAELIDESPFALGFALTSSSFTFGG